MKTSRLLPINTYPLRFLRTPSHLTGLGSYAAATCLSLINIQLAVIPLAVFILLCVTAPFFPGIGFFLPVIRKGKSDKNGVALTFDDGPDPHTTPLLLDLLVKYKITATFFVVGEKSDKHHDLIDKIIAQGHNIGNHTYRHDHLIMLKSMRRLQEEIEKTQQTLKKSGIVPLAFRPPAGITNPKLYKILERNGLYCVNFSRRARDAGNRRMINLSKKILKHVKPNDIIMLHDTVPKRGYSTQYWLDEMEKLIKGILDKGLNILNLQDILEKPVMIREEISHFQKKTINNAAL